MNSCKLYIVRHGQSEANRDHIVCGQMDSPLTELGIRQAQETKSLLKDVPFAAVYSSDLQRAIRTAEIISGTTVPASNQLPTLRERSFGTFEGKPDGPWKDVYEKFERKYDNMPLPEKWQRHYAPSIESNGELSSRFMRAIRNIGDNHSGETILIGSHSGCIRTTLLSLGYTTEAQLPIGVTIAESLSHSGERVSC